MKFIYNILIVSLLITSCNHTDAKSENNKILSKDSLKQTELTDVDSTSESGTPITSTTNWQYFNKVDKMTSKKSYAATLLAKEKLDLKAPYGDGIEARINITNRNGKNGVLLLISKGQLIDANTVENGKIRVRFDSNPPESFSVSASNDGSSNILFINDENKFISKVKTSKTLIIEATIYDNGSKQMEFPVANLKWEH